MSSKRSITHSFELLDMSNDFQPYCWARYPNGEFGNMILNFAWSIAISLWCKLLNSLISVSRFAVNDDSCSGNALGE